MTFRIQGGLRVSPEDYDRWMDMHDEIKWIFARTMPTMPHYYIVKGKNIDPEGFLLSFGVRRTFGQPGKFYSRTQIYLEHGFHEDVRYWSEDRDPSIAELMNMSKDGKWYGVQDAPITETGTWAEFDEIGAYWDFQYREMTSVDSATLWKLVHNNAEVPKPSMIDVGAGTGGSIEAQASASHNTLAIDPSRAMLNDLVVKFPNIKEVYPGTFLDWTEQANPKTQSRDIVVASLGSASYLSAEEIRRSREFAKHLTVLTFYAEVPSYRTDLPETHDEALKFAMSLDHSQTVRSGGFIYVVIP